MYVRLCTKFFVSSFLLIIFTFNLILSTYAISTESVHREELFGVSRDDISNLGGEDSDEIVSSVVKKVKVAGSRKSKFKKFLKWTAIALAIGGSIWLGKKAWNEYQKYKKLEKGVESFLDEVQSNPEQLGAATEGLGRGFISELCQQSGEQVEEMSSRLLSSLMQRTSGDSTEDMQKFATPIVQGLVRGLAQQEPGRIEEVMSGVVSGISRSMKDGVSDSSERQQQLMGSIMKSFSDLGDGEQQSISRAFTSALSRVVGSDLSGDVSPANIVRALRVAKQVGGLRCRWQKVKRFFSGERKEDQEEQESHDVVESSVVGVGQDCEQDSEKESFFERLKRGARSFKSGARDLATKVRHKFTGRESVVSSEDEEGTGEGNSGSSGIQQHQEPKVDYRALAAAHIAKVKKEMEERAKKERKEQEAARAKRSDDSPSFQVPVVGPTVNPYI